MQTVIVIVMTMTVQARWLTACAAVVLPLGLSACSSDAGEPAATSSSSTAAAGACPASPVNVVVSVDQWGDLVSQLGGDCATVTTIIASSSLDPHDYEPSPADAAKFVGAQLVVLNGGHYDEWADQLAESSAPDAPVVEALDDSHEVDDHADEHADEHGHEGDEHGHEGDDHGHTDDGVNPHVWYSPTAVTATADAVTAELSALAPEAASYFEEQHAAFVTSMQPYDQIITAIKAKSAGMTYAATESVFDDMAAAVGLDNATPEGYQVSSSNETDPSPADLDAFTRLLSDKGVDVLIYNTQTEGSVPQQLRSAAEAAGVPVVEVTESVAPGAETFQSWQVTQLQALAEALGVAI